MSRPTAEYANKAGTVALVHYTDITAMDRLEYECLEWQGVNANGTVTLGRMNIVRWVMGRFAVAIKTRPNPDAEWTSTPYTWDVLAKLLDESSADGDHIWMPFTLSQITAIAAKIREANDLKKK